MPNTAYPFPEPNSPPPQTGSCGMWHGNNLTTDPKDNIQQHQRHPTHIHTHTRPTPMRLRVSAPLLPNLDVKCLRCPVRPSSPKQDPEPTRHRPSPSRDNTRPHIPGLARHGARTAGLVTSEVPTATGGTNEIRSSDGSITFLTGGGHNGGLVSTPENGVVPDSSDSPCPSIVARHRSADD